MNENLNSKKIRLRTKEQINEDLGLLERGILDADSFEIAHQEVSNPVRVEVRDANGDLKALRYTSNLRTNDGADWQARLMSGAFTGFRQTNSAGITIVAPSGTAAGTIVDTNAGAGVTLNQYLGFILVMGSIYTFVVGNTASSGNSVTFYYDQWRSTDPTTVATTPSAAAYVIVVANSPVYYIGLSSDSTAPAATDHLLASELTTSGLNRAYGSGTYSAPNGYQHTAGTNVFTLSHQWTASAPVSAVQKCGCFTGSYFPNDPASALSGVGKGGGIMAFENTFASINMALNDTLTLTWTFTI